MAEPEAWPEEVRLKREARLLEIRFDDGSAFSLPAELLRVESPSAEVQGHGEGKTLVAGKRWVGIREIQPVGNYAIRIVFDDEHAGTFQPLCGVLVVFHVNKHRRESLKVCIALAYHTLV